MYIVPLSNLPTVQSGSAGETSAQSGGLPFREVMQQAVQSLQESQQAAAQDTYDLAYGNSADLHTIMIHSCYGNHSSRNRCPAHLPGRQCL